jgi:hypothetical protein
MDDDIIGVIKIKDGLFICDEFGAQVSTVLLPEAGYGALVEACVIRRFLNIPFQIQIASNSYCSALLS